MHNSKTKWLISLIVLALMLTVVSGVSAQSNIIVTLSVGGEAITVGDVIPLTLQVTHPAGWRVIVPTLEKQWGDFEVRSQRRPSSLPVAMAPKRRRRKSKWRACGPVRCRLRR